MQIDWSTASMRFVGESGQLIVFLAEEPDRAWIRAYNAIAERETGGKLWRKQKWGLASHAYGVGRRSVIGMFGSRPCDEESLRARLAWVVEEANRDAELGRAEDERRRVEIEAHNRAASEDLARRFRTDF
jgi:hypothetical protein